MNKKKIKTFRLMAVCMAAAMVLNNSGMTVLATGLDGIRDDSEEIIVLSEDGEETVDAEDDETEEDQDDVNDEDSEDTEDSEDSEDEEDSEDGEESEDDADDEDAEDGEDSDDEDSEDEEDSEDDADDEDSEDDADEEDSEDGEEETDEEEPEDGEEIETPDEEEADVLNASGTLSLTSDKTYTNEELNGYDNIMLNGHKLTVSDDFTSTAYIELGEGGELVVNGNMTANKEVKCDNGKLTVKGSYTQTSSRLYTYNGEATINISKDMIFKNTGYPYLYSGKDKVTVGGNLVYGSSYGVTDNNCVWTIKGNITQEEGASILKFANLVLAGTKGQTITLQENSELGKLTVNNSNVTIGNGYLNNVTLQTDFAPKATITLKTNEMNLNGHKFTTPKGFETTGIVVLGTNGQLIVNGDMTAGGEVRCDNGKLTVKGSYTQTSSRLYTYNGEATINISKDMIFKNTGYPYLYSGKEKVTVGGNFVYDSDYSTTDKNVVWTIKGNITQETGAADLKFSNLVLAGTTGQSIALQSNSQIGNLTAKNSDVTLVNADLNNVTLQTDFAPKATITLKTNEMNLNGHKFTTPKGFETTGIVVLGNNGQLIVNGDMIAGGEVKCDNGKLTVKGKYTQRSSYLQVNEGSATITISKDAVFKPSGYLHITSNEVKATVGGNFVYGSNCNTTSNDAEWTVKGNFTQEEGAAYFTVKTLKIPTTGKSVLLYDGKINTLVLGYGKKNYTITENCYDKLIATCTLTFNANGGSVDTKNKKVTTEQKYGELPVPTKANSDFEGWFTKKTGGDMITADTAVTAVDDFTVYAHWKEKPIMNFDDVHESDWFYNAVKYVFENGIMAGVNGGKSFDPYGKLKREQFTQVLYAYEGKPEVTQENIFSDVDSNAWYAKSVLWAKEKGITGGKPNGTFGVNENITRQDLAVMLYTYARYKGFDQTINDDVLDNFNDKGKISNYAKEAMKWAVTQGVISGKGNGKVDPLGNATRAECAQMIMKLFEKNK